MTIPGGGGATSGEQFGKLSLAGMVPMPSVRTGLGPGGDDGGGIRIGEVIMEGESGWLWMSS